MPSKKLPATITSPRHGQKKSGANIQRASREVQPATKKQQLIDLMSGAKPVSVEKMSKTLHWQPHTVRAAITGLRKSGFVVDSSKGPDGGGACYQIVSHSQSIEPAAR